MTWWPSPLSCHWSDGRQQAVTDTAEAEKIIIIIDHHCNHGDGHLKVKFHTKEKITATIGRGPERQNTENVMGLIFSTVFIHMNDLEMVCNHEKID